MMENKIFNVALIFYFNFMVQASCTKKKFHHDFITEILNFYGSYCVVFNVEF